MNIDPWRFNFQLSTTFRRGVKSWKTEKCQPFYPKLIYTFPRKKCTKLRKLRFFDFSFFFHKCKKITHRKSDSPWKMTPGVLIFSSLRLFAEGQNNEKLKNFSLFAQNWLTPPPEKNVRSYERYDFSTFHFFFKKVEKIIHRKSDSPWKTTPGALIFSSLRPFGEG